MSTTFIDPPGPLAGTSEPIDFTTDRLVTSISIEYRPTTNTGLRETVWDGTSDVDDTGGDFSYLYRTSTRTGSGPYTWTVRRNQPWPADFRIRVKEASAVPAPAETFWDELLSVDFTALSSQTFSATGNDYKYSSHTLSNGQTWELNGYVGTASLVNGLGVTVQGGGGFDGGNSANGGRFTIKNTAVPGFDAAKITCVQVRFRTATLTDTLPGNCDFGAVSWFNGVSPGTINEGGAHSMIINAPDTSTRRAFWLSGGGYGGAVSSTLNIYTEAVVTTTPKAYEFCLGVVTHPNWFYRWGLTHFETSRTTFPSVEKMTVNGVGLGGPPSLGVLNLGGFWAATPAMYMTHCRILQKAL
jgi:hypothetical protein